MIPFLDLKAQYLSIKTEIDTAVLDVLASTQFSLGSAVIEFEHAFANYCTTRYAIGVDSGTSALHLALLAAGIGPGDEVITVPMTFVATVAAIEYVGATPVFVDIAPDTWNMDTSALDDAITERTKAILPVHLHGQVADMNDILRIAQAYNLMVIEDAAQAHGAMFDGRRAGSFGQLGCFSFYPGKNLGAYGESGAVVTDNEAYARKIAMLRDWGQDGKYNHRYKGFNYRMDNIQGAVLGVKLKYIHDWTEARRERAAYYDQLFAHSGLVVPQSVEHHVYHIYAVRVPDRDKVQERLHQYDIQTSIHYPIPVHLQPAYAELGYQRGDFPHSEALADDVLSLPLFPELTREHQDCVAQVLLQAV